MIWYLTLLALGFILLEIAAWFGEDQGLDRGQRLLFAALGAFLALGL